MLGQPRVNQRSFVTFQLRQIYGGDRFGLQSGPANVPNQIRIAPEQPPEPVKYLVDPRGFIFFHLNSIVRGKGLCLKNPAPCNPPPPISGFKIPWPPLIRRKCRFLPLQLVDRVPCRALLCFFLVPAPGRLEVPVCHIGGDLEALAMVGALLVE